ncbi:MAG TPA: histidine phosphatase family protein [Pseudonocardia sp.]|nr:histidine phosphatase family protein [Pseudonocardia sp.]
MATRWAVDEPVIPHWRRIRLVAVRHAESVWNAEGRAQGHLGPGLTATGRVQAAATADHLHARYGAVGLVLTSDLDRVVETAEPYCRASGITPVLEPRLREIDNGSWSGLPLERIQREHAEDLMRIRRGEDIPRGGGESFADLRARVRNALADLAAGLPDRVPPHTELPVIAFSHGGPIRALVAELLGLPPGGHARVEPAPNCAITEVVVWVDATGALVSGALVAYNSRDHLAHLVTQHNVDQVAGAP